MKQRGFRRQRRSAVEWSIRGGLATLALVIGVATTTTALALVLKGSAPARAHALAPWDGRITAELAEKRFVSQQPPQPSASVEKLARQALRQDATAVSAATTLGLEAQLRGDAGAARRLLSYSESLSRRNLETQLWAIEDAVSRNDIKGALHHYDIALRTSARAPDILFRILVGALDDASIRGALVQTLATQPPWAGLFVEFASAYGPDPRATALLFGELSQHGYPVPGTARVLLTNKLASEGMFNVAWRYYTTFRSRARADSARDPGFTADLRSPTIFDWHSVATEGLVASIQHGLIDFAAPATIGGTLVQQFQMLPPGEYRLAGHSIAIEDADGALPYWALLCQDGRELGRVIIPPSAENNGDYSGRFRVPASCPVQKLALIARASYNVSGMVGQIDRAQLAPVE